MHMRISMSVTVEVKISLNSFNYSFYGPQDFVSPCMSKRGVIKVHLNSDNHFFSVSPRCLRWCVVIQDQDLAVDILFDTGTQEMSEHLIKIRNFGDHLLVNP